MKINKFQKLKQDLIKHLSITELEKIENLFNESQIHPDEYTRLLGLALIHEVFNKIPTNNRLGYQLAKYYQDDFNKSKSNDLQKRILISFDIKRYIYNNTCYNDCIDGNFFTK